MQSSTLDVDKTYKIIIIGDSQVGKTSILKRFVSDTFSTTLRSTIGADFGSKVVNLEGKSINLNIWDTAGQEAFRAITNQYYRQAVGTLIVFDVTDKKTFDNIPNWLADLEKNSDDKKIIKLLIGNKIDLERKVSQEMGDLFATKNKMAYIETSAFNNTNIETVFLRMTKAIIDSHSSFAIPPKNSKIRSVGPGKPFSTSEKPTNGKSCICGKDYSS